MADVKIISKQNGVAIVLPSDAVFLGDPDGDYVAEAGALSTQVSIKRAIDDFQVVKDLAYTNIKDKDGVQIGTSRDNCVSVLNSTYLDPATKLGSFDDIEYTGSLTKGQVLTIAQINGSLRWTNLAPAAPDVVVETVVNSTAGTLSKGTPVHITGEDPAGNPTVIAARADTESAMPAHFILNEDVTTGSSGKAILTGRIVDVDTSGFSAGDAVYVAAAGGYTTTKPTGANLVQKIGVITHVDSTEGAGIVTGAGRTNDIPNLGRDEVFLGIANGYDKRLTTSLTTMVALQCNFFDDIATSKHYLPLASPPFEQPSNNNSYAAYLMPTSGKVTQILFRLPNSITAGATLTFTVEKAAISAYDSNETIQETQTIAVTSTDDRKLCVIPFSNNFVSKGELLFVSVRSSADISTNQNWYATVNLELQWNNKYTDTTPTIYS